MRRLYKRPESPIWWGIFYDKQGNRHRVSTKCLDRKAAEARLKDLERASSGVSVDQPAYPLKDAIIDFSENLSDVAKATIIMYKQKGGHLTRLLGDLDTARIKRDDVQEYVKKRLEEGVTSHTVHKELVTLRRVLKLAEQRELPAADYKRVIPDLRSGYIPKTRYLTEVEYTSLLAALAPQHKNFLRVAVYTGGRKSELENMTWEHVDLGKGWIHMPGTKTEKSRRNIPIEEPLRRCLEATPKHDRQGRLLDRWLHVDRDLLRASIRVGIPRVSCNDLRRTFASWLLQKGVDPFTVARLLGHGSTTMVYRVYGQLEQHNLTKAVGMLPDPEGIYCDNSVTTNGPNRAQKAVSGTTKYTQSTGNT